MNKLVNYQSVWLILGVPISIIALMIVLANSSVFVENPHMMATGITLDLLGTLPLVYFLLIRKTKIPKTTIVPVLILGIIICSLILPTENQHALNQFKTWVLPVVELGILTFVAYHIRKAIKSFSLSADESFDFHSTLKRTCYEILPKALVIPVITEISVFYYGFIYWKGRPLKENEFSYHKNSGTIPLLMGIILIVAVETVVLHILLSKWSNIAAWILSFVSIYSGIQLFGFLKSMLKRPFSLDKDSLNLRYGIMTDTKINVKDIESIEISTKEIKQDMETRRLSLLGELESHNFIIRLRRENILTGLYGRKRSFKNLLLYVDDPKRFKDQIEKAISDIT